MCRHLGGGGGCDSTLHHDPAVVAPVAPGHHQRPGRPHQGVQPPGGGGHAALAPADGEGAAGEHHTGGGGGGPGHEVPSHLVGQQDGQPGQQSS